MLYNVWNPVRLSEHEIGFEVTKANVSGVGSGTAEWIEACLEAIELSATPLDWSIQPARCHFYSDYRDSSEWEDRWPETWLVRVELDERAPHTFGDPEAVPGSVDQRDPTWEHDTVDEAHDRTALLLFFSKGPRAQAASMRSELKLNLPPALDVSGLQLQVAGPDWFRLRTVVRGELFPERLLALESAVKQAEQAGLVVQRHGLMEP